MGRAFRCRSDRGAASVRLGLGMLALCIASSALAGSGEYCVTCNGPGATYRCAAQLPLTARPTTATGEADELDPRLQWACISELAQSGGHASCVVERLPSGRCDGPLKTVVLPSVPDADPMPPPASGPPQVAHDPGPEPGAVGGSGPPATMEELARKSVEDSQKGLAKASETVAGIPGQAGAAVTETAKTTGRAIGAAGEAVGSTVKKSIDCVARLFKDC